MAFNPDDTRIVVPKRTRLGWTLNMGRPLAWLVLALVIAAAIAIGYINSRH